MNKLNSKQKQKFVALLQKLSLALAVSLCANLIYADDVSIKITGQYLNLPVSHRVERAKMTFSIKDKEERSFVIRLSATPEYWVFTDVSAYKGKNITIRYEGDASGLNKIFQADTIVGQSVLYKEENRPQLHFTTRRGWTNDPNGLIYYEGEYHLFYQHNPYEREWENMHWGHAVSRDLIHWTELSDALFPDRLGAMFSGTAVIDYENTSGFGAKENPAMVAIYTAANPDRQIQCLAYSTDKGRTWTKYANNPVVDSKEKWNSHDTRDPKVFWHAPSKTWVMALNERDGHSIYNSPNLKDWTFESHTIGFWECPDLFELPVDGDKKNTLWVMYGASGTYMLGHFDGKKFMPVTGKNLFEFGSIYAAQTFNNMPATDGRRIQIGWDRIDNPGMSFKSQMSLPTELTLRSTANGIRLFCNPIKEVNSLQNATLVSEKNISREKANELLNQYKDEPYLRIKFTLKFTHATSVGLTLYGQTLIDYDLNFNRVNDVFYSQSDFSGKEISADIILDKTSVQVFFDHGGLSYCMQRSPQANNREGFNFWGHQPELKNLEVYSMKSIWK